MDTGIHVFIDMQSLLTGNLGIIMWMRGCTIRDDIKFVPPRQRTVPNICLVTLKTMKDNQLTTTSI